MLKLEDVYDVVVAKDGQEAYDMVKESMSKNQFFDLIFMDIQVGFTNFDFFIYALY
jgi:osomolarity two-component system sensor histidine kinase SLN1